LLELGRGVCLRNLWGFFFSCGYQGLFAYFAWFKTRGLFTLSIRLPWSMHGSRKNDCTLIKKHQGSFSVGVVCMAKQNGWQTSCT
jgi:hypothetical protein